MMKNHQVVFLYILVIDLKMIPLNRITPQFLYEELYYHTVGATVL
jgi:hypothetical protein